MRQLHMFGADHHDPQGDSRTLNALQGIQPDVLATEWCGREYDEYSCGNRMQRLRSEVERQLRPLLQEFGVCLDAYGRANEIGASHYGEVRAAKEYAEQNGIPIFPTESAEKRMQNDEDYYGNPKNALLYFRQLLEREQQSGRTYDPLSSVAFHPWEYEQLELHLAGQLQNDEVSRWLREGYLDQGVINPQRLADQTERIVTAIDTTPRDGVIAHVGGLAHLLDDTSKQRTTLFQYVRDAMRETLSVHRHSLSKY